MTAGAAIVIAARRSPIGRAGGSLRSLRLEALAAPVLSAALADAGLDPAEVDEVILGNAAGPGGNPARLSLLAAGWPVAVPGVTVDRQCGSGLEAIVTGARLIESGAAEIVVAGGVESVSTAPWRAERPASPTASPRFFDRPPFSPQAIGDPEMGVAAENVARACAITRERQDGYALASHRKAVAAQRAGRFAGEIVPLVLPDGRVVESDECPRPDTSLDRLAALAPAFVPGGTVTAGNACPVNDGAAAAVLVSERRFRAMPGAAGLRLVAAAAAGVDPNLLGLGPVVAVRRMLARHPALDLDRVGLVEFNEAFAAQVLACLDALAIPEAKVSVAGGALALGHPWGASGAVLVTRLFSEMVRLSPNHPAGAPRLGLATLGIGGGLGLAALFERV